MGEHHQIAGPARGEPRPAGSIGACVRVPLDAAPSPHWSHLLAAHFARHLCGERRVGHLRLDGLVQGADVVLDGVEPDAAEALGPALQQAIEDANRACADPDHPDRPRNMKATTAEAVARAVAG